MIEPMLVENFLVEEEIKLLLDASCNCNEAFIESSQNMKEARWRLRAAYTHKIRKYNNEAAECMMNIAYKIQDILRVIESTNELFVEIPQMSKWFPDDKLDPPHADNCHPDGSPNTSPHRSHGAIVYLNEDFDGGELFYPNFDCAIKPKRGMLALHGAGLLFLHGVKKVSRNFRHTMITFATMNQNYIKENNMERSFLHDR